MIRLTPPLSALLLAALALTGCASAYSSGASSSAGTSATTTTAAATTDSAHATPARKGRVHHLANGIVYEDLVIGDGRMADPGLTAVVHYTGWFTNGVKFDSSFDRGEPLPFEIGGGHVIRGWDEGVRGMRVGGKRRLTIPPDLAYGKEGMGVVPPDATLIFEVQLVGVK